MSLIEQYKIGMLILALVILLVSVVLFLLFRSWLLEIFYLGYAVVIFLSVAVPLWFYVCRQI